MGSKSRSATTSNNITTNVQDIDTTTIGLEDVDTGIVGNSGDVQITQISTDAGAVDKALDFGREIGDRSLDFAEEFGGDALKEAFDFGDEALGTVEKGLDRSLDFGDKTVTQAFTFGGKALDNLKTIQTDSTSSAQKSITALSNALGTVGSLSRSDTSDTLTKIIPWVAGALGIGVAAMAFARRA